MGTVDGTASMDTVDVPASMGTVDVAASVDTVDVAASVDTVDVAASVDTHLMATVDDAATAVEGLARTSQALPDSVPEHAEDVQQADTPAPAGQR